MRNRLILAAILAASVILLIRPAESYESDYERRLQDSVERNSERLRQRLEQSYQDPSYRSREQVIITPNGPAFIQQDRNGTPFIYGPAVQPHNHNFR